MKYSIQNNITIICHSSKTIDFNHISHNNQDLKIHMGDAFVSCIAWCWNLLHSWFFFVITNKLSFDAIENEHSYWFQTSSLDSIVNLVSMATSVKDRIFVIIVRPISIPAYFALKTCAIWRYLLRRKKCKSLHQCNM